MARFRQRPRLNHGSLEVDLKKDRMLILNVCIAMVAVLLMFSVLISGCGSRKSDEAKESGGTTENTENVEIEKNENPSSVPQGISKSKQALEQAKAEGKPVLLKFGSGTCVPCVQMDENIDAIRPEYEGKAVFIIVDLNDQSENDFAMEYDVQTIPTTIFIKKDGTAGNGYVGVLTPEQLRSKLDSII